MPTLAFWGYPMSHHGHAAATIKTAYIHLAAYYQQVIPDRTLLMYAEDLADLPPQEILLAMRKLRREPGRRTCPLPSDIRKLIAPDTVSDGALANDIAARIGSAMSRYGYTNPGRAEQYIGPVGWVVVKLLGGWQYLCNTITTDEMGTFRAQCRELAKSQLALSRARPREAARELPAGGAPRELGPKTLTSAAEILERSVLPPRCDKV